MEVINFQRFFIFTKSPEEWVQYLNACADYLLETCQLPLSNLERFAITKYNENYAYVVDLDFTLWTCKVYKSTNLIFSSKRICSNLPYMKLLLLYVYEVLCRYKNFVEVVSIEMYRFYMWAPTILSNYVKLRMSELTTPDIVQSRNDVIRIYFPMPVYLFIPEHSFNINEHYFVRDNDIVRDENCFGYHTIIYDDLNVKYFLQWK